MEEPGEEDYAETVDEELTDGKGLDFAGKLFTVEYEEDDDGDDILDQQYAETAVENIVVDVFGFDDFMHHYDGTGEKEGDCEVEGFD